MISTLIKNSSIALASLAFGIMAGFFWTYTFNVNLAMLQVDGPTYAVVQSLFNENVRHPMFFSFFIGSAVLALVALAMNVQHWKSLSFSMLSLALIIYVTGIIMFTAQVNLPLNYYTESWDPTNLPADWSSVRTQWNNANATRVITSASSFVLSLAALVTRASLPLKNKKQVPAL